jgi:RNA polymerase sigma factor (sigma-70 family)
VKYQFLQGNGWGKAPSGAGQWPQHCGHRVVDGSGHEWRWQIARAARRSETVQIYLKDIEGTKLLSPEEEVALARAIRAGDGRARERFIKANLRLVVSTAKQFQNRGLPLMDLIEEGNLGLVKAVERFNPDEGTRFSTYGVWWIKQAIRKAIVNYAKTIRIPGHMHEMLSKIRKRMHQMTTESGGAAPSIEEVMQDMQLKPDTVEMVRKAMQTTISTDAEPDESGRRKAVKDSIADERFEDPADAMLSKEALATLAPLLGRLSPREAEVIKRHYGIGYPAPQTYREIGLAMKMTRERARQLAQSGLKHLQEQLEPDHSVA